jgi:hypothetical protein
MTREPKLDRRDLPRYTPQEASHHLSLLVSTVRAWSVGQHGRPRDKPRFFHPLISPAQKAPLSLSFWNLVELYALRCLRRTHDFPMPQVRAALRFTGEKLGACRPLIEETFYSDGVNLLVERLSSLIDTSDGQTVMRGVLVDSLRRVERGHRRARGSLLSLAQRTQRGSSRRDRPGSRLRPLGSGGDRNPDAGDRRAVRGRGASGFRVGPECARGIEEMPWGG